MFSRIPKSIVICLVIITASSCSLLKPYQAELGQGNYIRSEQRQQLAVGQTPDQVSFLLGTPVLTGEFPNERWTYATYNDQRGYLKLVIEFENGLVSSIYETEQQLSES